MAKYDFRIIAQAAEADYTIKKSKFIAYAFHCGDLEAIQSRLEEVRNAHHKARHHCYAYRLGLDQNNFRANDDGEPSGTAGRPILGQIDSKGLTNTLVVVVRYFGGIKLGVSGLISAYKNAAKTVLEQCIIIAKKVTKEIKLRTDFLHIGVLMTQAKKLGFELVSTSYEPFPEVTLKVPLENLETNLIKLKARTMNISEEEAQTITDSNVFYILDE